MWLHVHLLIELNTRYPVDAKELFLRRCLLFQPLPETVYVVALLACAFFFQPVQTGCEAVTTRFLLQGWRQFPNSRTAVSLNRNLKSTTKTNTHI